MKTNGLLYSKIKSSSDPIDIKSDGDILENTPENAWFIAYLYHRVVIGRIENKQFVYYKQKEQDVTLSKILKLRVFNDNAELFVWRTNLGGYNARLRKDGTGEEQGVVDAHQVLFGTKAELIDNTYLKLTEERGTEIILPLKELNISEEDVNNHQERLCIHTRSYIGFIEDTGQATYVDIRFVEFIKYQEEK